MAQHPPKISGTGQSYGPSDPRLVQEKSSPGTDSIPNVWRTFITALGQTAPAHVNRTRRAITHLRHYGG